MPHQSEHAKHVGEVRDGQVGGVGVERRAAERRAAAENLTSSESSQAAKQRRATVCNTPT